MKLSIQQLQEMEKKYAKYWWKKDEEAEYRKISSDPFKLLIFTILSQNTSGINTRRAYAGLSKKFSIDASTLSNAREEEIALAIKPGGLYKIKARRIKQVSKYIMDKYKGNLKKLLSEDKEKNKRRAHEITGSRK
ncbi:MAG: hypothetical protein DRN29_06380 [Thermoplasmata archaeon]|nr:MAG: hypothetical protein DRN29_06380 [Thermoplasmata archaeon]